MDKQQQIRWMGAMSTGQDVTIHLVHSYCEGNEPQEEMLAVVQIHSSILTMHSKYFSTCLSKRWRELKTLTGPESTCNIKKFVLEAQADVDCYLHCFACMYAPVRVMNNVSDILFGIGLLKVASQIEFHELMESTSLNLSSRFWSKEDETRIREYSSTPDFPRNQAKDLVIQLGLNINKSEQEDCHEQFWLVIEQIIHTAVNPQCDKSHSEQVVDRAFIAELLQGRQGPQAIPSDSALKVIKLLTSKSKSMMIFFGSECEWVRIFRTLRNINVSQVNKFGEYMEAICWVLRALLKQKQAEELVACFVHEDAIPDALCHSLPRFLRSHDCTDVLSNKDWMYASKLADVVLLIYEEAVAGRLVLKTRERMALLANWHPLLQKVYVTAEAITASGGEPNLMKSETQLNLVATELFSTLPLKEQMEFIKKQDNPPDFITNNTSFAFTLLKSLASHGIASSNS